MPALDGRTDFDFLHGTWHIVNRRRRTVLRGCEEWQEFAAIAQVEPVLGGLGHVETFSAVMPDGSPLDGLTLRVFNPETRLWSMHWADSRTATLIPPVVGRFVNGMGEFHGAYSANGREVRILFVWADITESSARWTQAFSLDDGATWEWNWEMRLTRVAAPPTRIDAWERQAA
jgi:hypothetical protein